MPSLITSDNGVSSGSAGLKTTASNDGILVLQTTTSGGTATNAVYVDTTQNVGIGTSSPNGYKLAIGDGASNRGRIYLKGATGGNYPEINIDDTMNTSGKNYQMYSTGGVLKVSNQTDGNVSFVANGFGIGLGDNAPVDGDGIRFPATQAASSNANTLDDYEEGTWTPTATSGGGSITTYSTTGTYTKIGDLVFVRGRILLTTVGTASGNLTVGGLPFTTSNTARPFTGIVREDEFTGFAYLSFGNANATTFPISSLTGGAIAWTNGYSYVFSATYKSA